MSDPAMETVTAAVPSSPSSGSTFPTSVYDHTSFSNTTSSPLALLPSIPKEFIMLSLRFIYRVELFLFVTLPGSVVRALGLDRLVGSLIERGADLIGELDGVIDGGTVDAVAGGMEIAGTDGVAGAAAAAEAANESGFSFGEMLYSLKRFSGFFNYMTSKWSIGCFAVALILNRVSIYASTRRHLSLKWNRRLLLRIIPIILFATQIVSLLRACRCQTSPDYALLRYGKSKPVSTFDYAGEGGFLYKLSSFLLQWEDDRASCSAVSMAQPAEPGKAMYGSFSLLWPAFLRLCLGHFVETLSCALQGRPVATEAGMSVFEHSLAFAEAETMLTQSIGLGLFGNIKAAGSAEAENAMASGTAKILTRNQALERLNVTPELLLITLISTSNSLTSNILDVFGKQSRYRLINTTIWGLCFMAAILWGVFNLSILGHDATVLRFPTVCIVGFVPHLLILVGILTCGVIYLLALLLTACSLPSDLPRPTSFRERLALAHANMQGSSQVQNIRFNPHDDFYTTLVRIGYSSLTAASEAVFLNEGKGVVAKRMTWLEEDRLAEILASRSGNNPRSGITSVNPPFEADDGLDFKIPDGNSEWQTGYSQEKKFEKRRRGARSVKNETSLGSVGAFQGPARFHHGFTFLKGIFFLLVGWIAFGLVRLLERVGIVNRPQWLIKLAGTARKAAGTKRTIHQRSLDFWILTDEGVLQLPETNDFDVEQEMRKREMMHHGSWGEPQETQFEKKLYNWWKLGGAWGEKDESGDYNPPSDDWDDSTSVVSVSTDGEWESDLPDGRKTPTQEDPYPPSLPEPRSTTPDTLIDTASLARLLNPKDRETRLEARILSSHLLAGQEGRIMTRSQFKRQTEMERARVLTASRSPHPYFSRASEASNGGGRPSAEEEAEILEKLILSRRRSDHGQSSANSDSAWETGATGLGPSGPQCVVCQAAPRSIITWPCRCLCICEECRVSLAMNNFGSCVTCRRDVAGFVRLWVP
ncbi:hypothetical protein CPC735_023610 [Coccidioides posadasii C735 delta SOWgp]|nr:hypothetical protein CPC735_023610 [Coccidioides posadasii C735 delta SOWgp]EER27025.1 hypothetical protein CPC735_023610 [Coccidioides posadasii C735 delta SOWgp]|eukprot:XP_003069170.1 hypothetical protein CPC735_023610 [Coccidioides posadasii C735 delta SOWgp]